METRLTPLHVRMRRFSGRSRPLRGFAGWAGPPESSQYGLGAPVANIMAAKSRKNTKARKAAVTDKLRAMVQDVGRWPLSDQLMRTLDALDEGSEACAAPADSEPSPTAKTPRKKN